MDVAFITDTHFGARQDKQIILNSFIDFFEKDFFPYLLSNNIKHVVHCGDLVDRRKFINFNTLQGLKKIILWFEENDINLYIIIGNHDTFYKNTNDLNVLNEIFGHTKFKYIHLITEPTEITFSKKKFLLMPWTNSENRIEYNEIIDQTTAPILCGHFDINGFDIQKGFKYNSGEFTPHIFNKFQNVFSGHFHIKQKKNNILYLGTPYWITWGDYGQKKGFHIYNTETGKIKFVQNKRCIFKVIEYDEDYITFEDIEKMKFDIEGNYVKLKIKSKTDEFLYDRFLSKLQEENYIDLNIIDEEIFELDDSETDIAVESTMATIKNYIDDSKHNDNDKLSITSKLYDLHNRVINGEDV